MPRRGLPASSWWLERDAFFDRAHQEQERMKQSLLGQSSRIVLAADTERISPADTGVPLELEAHDHRV